MSVRKIVGDVTAYAAAVKGGYEGTYEQFCADQANFAKNATEVAGNLAESKELLANAKTTIEAEAVLAANAAKDIINTAANERLGDFDAVGAVRFDRQELSQTQKEQAKANVDACDAIVCEASSETVTISDASDQPLRGLKLYGKSVQNGTPTPENPVEIKNAVVSTVSSVGANLIPFPYYENSKTFNGITWTVNSDGSITANGTASIEYNSSFNVNIDISLPAGTYTLSGVPTGFGKITSLTILYNNGNEYVYVSAYGGEQTTFTLPTSIKNGSIYLQVLSGNTVSNAVFKPILNKGETALPYEPYKGGTATLAQPVTLPGIPVSSGGNYTDANGQQWICDKMDFARGVYVQRVGKVDLGTLSWASEGKDSSGLNRYASSGIANLVMPYTVNYICTHYPVGFANNHTNGIKEIVIHPISKYATVFETYETPEALKTSLSGVMLYYELETPVETPISETDLTAYRTLHTNKLNTTVYTDSNAGLTVAYAADTKTYIDNKFAELAAAVLQNA